MLSKSSDPLVPRITPRGAFLRVFGRITFRRIDSNPIAGWAETHMDWASNYCGMGAICYDESIFTDSGLASFQKWGPQNVVHELGHALDQRGGRRARADLQAEWATNSGFPRRTTGEFGGFAGPYLGWQQTQVATAGEEFADMFLGWAYNQWETSPAGATRSGWMNANMPRWISLAVTGN